MNDFAISKLKILRFDEVCPRPGSTEQTHLPSSFLLSPSSFLFHPFSLSFPHPFSLLLSLLFPSLFFVFPFPFFSLPQHEHQIERVVTSPSSLASPKKRSDDSVPSPSSGLLSPELDSPEIPPEGAGGEEDADAADESMDPEVLTAQVESHVIAKENPLYGTDPGERLSPVADCLPCAFFFPFIAF